MKDTWRCPVCGGDDVETEAWVHCNTGVTGSSCGSEEFYCNTCMDHFRGLCEVTEAGECRTHGGTFEQCREQACEANCEACIAEEPDPTEHREGCIFAERLGCAGRVAP